MTVGVLGYPTTLDPYSPVASDLTRAIARPVYPSLYRLDPSGRPVGDLAASLDTEGDTAVVRIRRARWSDSTPVRASDVVATVRRAREPSGLAGLIAEARGPRVVALRGFGGRGPDETLAIAAPILPDGRPGGPYGGPFVVRETKPGLKVVLGRNPRYHGDPSALDRVDVVATAGLEIAIGLLERGDLDAAALPMSVNLDERLDALGIPFSRTESAEEIYLDLSELDPARRLAVARAIRPAPIFGGLIRDDGEPFPLVVPEGGGSVGDVRLAAPSGDELLELIQRILQRQLQNAENTAELVTVEAGTFYGPWALDAPVDIAVRRAVALPGRQTWDRAGASFEALPLFSVDAVIARGPRAGGVSGPAADGPLWDVQSWFVQPGSG